MPEEFPPGNSNVVEMTGKPRKGVVMQSVGDVRRVASRVFNDFQRAVGEDWGPKEVTAASSILSLIHKLIIDQDMEARLQELESKVNGIAKRA